MPDDDAPNILIVDDDEDILFMLTKLLSSRGYHCRVGCSGAQGAVEFNVSDVDLVITDLNMPAGDGVALIERIRRISDVPIIVVTAFSKEYSAFITRQRKTTVMQKPFDSSDLLDLIEIELAVRRAEQTS